MKNNISRANISRWEKHLEDHEFDPHRLNKLQTHSAENRKRKFQETEVELYKYKTPKIACGDFFRLA